MSEAPTDSLQILLGREVLQICYGSHQQQIRLDGDVDISVEGRFALAHDGADIQLDCDRPQTCVPLIALLGKSVISVENASSRLRIDFSDGYSVVFGLNPEGYETVEVSGPSITFLL